jgi:hypothetical protein
MNAFLLYYDPLKSKLRVRVSCVHNKCVKKTSFCNEIVCYETVKRWLIDPIGLSEIMPAWVGLSLTW